MVFYDKFGKTWKGRKIVWIRSSNSSGLAHYRLDYRDGKKVFIYDRKNGTYDKKGRHYQYMYIDIIPALEGQDDKGNPVPNTWELFPNTEDANSFKKSITRNGTTHGSENYDLSDFDEEFDEDIINK